MRKQCPGFIQATYSEHNARALSEAAGAAGLVADDCAPEIGECFRHGHAWTFLATIAFASATLVTRSLV